ncbi:MAG: hypothetical protein NWQ28_03990 [Nodularia sp. (in: cyanobacteria)]|nr:hypothetical protein [Nodularia sp. (in: cyanobacteria)]
MSNRHYPPAYLRYLKARLLNLAKPSFWVTAIFLSVIGLVIREYWSNPNILTYNQNAEFTAVQSDNSDISTEDRAIVADIDNFPALFEDLQQANLPITVTIPPKLSPANNQENSLKQVNKQQSANSAASSSGISTFNITSPDPVKNPFVSEAENLLQSGTFNIGNQVLGISSLTASSQPTATGISGIGVNQTDNSQNTDAMRFSQPPLNPSSQQNLSVLNGETANQINSLGQTSAGGVMQTPPKTGLNAATGIPPTVAIPNSQPLNSFNNVNSIQSLPSPVQPTPVISPAMSGIQTGTETNAAPYSLEPPNPTNVTPMSPVVADQNGNLIWRSPSQQMQPNSSDSPQTPGQNRGRFQNNNLRNLGF